MKREDLKAMNLPDDQVDKIIQMHGADVEKQKQTIATLTAARDDLQQRLNDANTKLEGYDPEWKSKAAQAQTDANNKIQALEREYALKEQAAGLKFSSESAKKAFLADLAAKELPIQEGKVLGFDDYVKKYKESDPGAFLSEQTPPRFSGHAEGTPAGGTAKDQANAALRAAFGNSN